MALDKLRGNVMPQRWGTSFGRCALPVVSSERVSSNDCILAAFNFRISLFPVGMDLGSCAPPPFPNEPSLKKFPHTYRSRRYLL